MSRFEGRTVVVTGAASGIGAATCQRFVSEGAHVVGVDCSPLTEGVFADDVAETRSVQLDLGEPIAPAFLDDLGDIDVLVNAAGVLYRNDIHEHTRSEWEHTLAVNVRAPFRLAALFVNQCLRRAAPGAIVNVCSIESFTAAPRHAAYTASKTAVLMMTRSLALEVADRGIRVNGIAPGVTATGMNQALREDEVASARLLGRIPMKRFGKPEDQAAAIAFLASDEAAYITGAVLPVDGGWLTA